MRLWDIKNRIHILKHLAHSGVRVGACECKGGRSMGSGGGRSQGNLKGWEE